MKLYPTSRIYILDVKRRDFEDLQPYIVQTDYEAPGPPDKRLQIWQPLVEEPEQIERWLFNIRRDAPAFIDIDELLSLCYGSRNTSEQFKIIQKLGRDLPIGTMAGTQELVEIPRNAIGQADHYIRFRLRHPYEISRMNTIMGGVLDEPMDKYGFYYTHADDQGEPRYFSDLTKFF